MEASVRCLLAFLVAKELGCVCRCGRPALVDSNARAWFPVCDECAASEENARFTDWRDLPHAPHLRALMAGSL